MAPGGQHNLGRHVPQVDTTAISQEGGASEAQARRRARKRASQRAKNAKVLLTRRQALFGALGLGAVAAGAAGVHVARSSSNPDEEVATLEVPEEAVLDLESYSEVAASDAFGLIGDFELPFGTLVWADDESVAACLFPTEEPSPLVNLGVLSLSSGSYFILREEAVSAEEGFEVFDVRATASGMVWLEAAVAEGLWRIYVATLGADFSLGEPRLVAQGDGTTEVPSLTVAGDAAFWQTMAPVSNENARREPSALHRAEFAVGDAKVIYEATGRMSAPPVPYEESIVFAPRHPDALSYCDLVRIDAKTGRVLDQLTLPSGMFPNQVGFGPPGFAFCFENIYDYGGGIANLGTYSPAVSHDADNYADIEWFRFNRTPTAAPCWCTDKWFMVKSNQSVCAVNFEHKVFCSFGVESGCLDWGDYLVSSGMRNIVVSAMQIDQVDNEGEETKMTQVRVWQPLATIPEGSSSADSGTEQDQQEQA